MAKYLYIDESGDLGFSQAGSSAYLVIAYIGTDDRIRLDRIVRKEKRRLNIGRRCELKGSSLTDIERRKVLRSIASINDLEVGAVIVDKSKVKPHLRVRRAQNILYAYVGGLVVLPYLARHDGVHVYPDERSVKVSQGNIIQDYWRVRLATKYGSPNVFNYQPRLSHICLGLQAADVVANTIWRKYERGDASAYPLIKQHIVDEFVPFK